MDRDTRGIPLQSYNIFNNFANNPIKIFVRYSDYEIAFSTARLGKYLHACGGNSNKALSLYRLNIQLCQKFYAVINVFEVILRNAIHRHYTNYYNDEHWIKNQLGNGGLLERSPQITDVRKIITSLETSRKYNSDKMVSSVSFGFWTYLFTKHPFRRGGNSLLAIFPNKEKGLNQRNIFNDLQTIKNFRNRIAHQEAICFDSKGNINLDLVSVHYNLINKYIGFLGYTPHQILYGLNTMPESTITKILLL